MPARHVAVDATTRLAAVVWVLKLIRRAPTQMDMRVSLQDHVTRSAVRAWPGLRAPTFRDPRPFRAEALTAAPLPQELLSAQLPRASSHSSLGSRAHVRLAGNVDHHLEARRRHVKAATRVNGLEVAGHGSTEHTPAFALPLAHLVVAVHTLLPATRLKQPRGRPKRHEQLSAANAGCRTIPNTTSDRAKGAEAHWGERL